VENIETIKVEVENKVINPLIEIVDASFLGIFAYLSIFFHFYPFYQFSKDGFKKYIQENLETVKNT